MMRRPFWILLVAAALASPSLPARTFLTQQQALAAAFPPGNAVERQSVFLTRAQLEDARKESGLDLNTQLVIRYVGNRDGRCSGVVYFDTHRVRTLPETVMIVVGTDARIGRVEILSFDEPTDYLPRRRWLDQLSGRQLDGELSLDRSIRPISGASLSGRAIVDASRRILALHRAIEGDPRSARCGAAAP